jgi:hypothetical protein
MKYATYINEFKAKYQAIVNDPTNDRSKPKKGSRYVEIMVWGKENDQAVVELRYCEEFYRMFGRQDQVSVYVFEGSLKEACQVAKELKKETNGLKISYIEYQELEMWA